MQRFVALVLLGLIVVAYAVPTDGLSPPDTAGERAYQPAPTRIRINVVMAPTPTPPPSQAQINARWHLGMMWRVLLWGVVLVIVLTPVGVGWYFYDRRAEEKSRPKDGQYPLRQIRHNGVDYLVDPNSFAGYGIGINGAVFELVSDMGAEAQLVATRGANIIRALAGMQRGGKGRGGATATMFDMMAGVNEQKARERKARADIQELKLLEQQSKTKVEEVPQLLPPPPTMDEAVMTSNAQSFVIGYTDDGQVCKINLQASIHCAIVGATGTGKTASIGMKMIVDCVRNGYHTIILDGMGGDDLGVFDRHTEWHDSTPESFGRQLAALLREHDKRLASCGGDRAAKKSLTPIAVFVEEFNEIWSKMEGEQIEFAEPILDTLLNKGRHTRIHMVFIGQESDEWPDAIFNAAKAKVVFQTGVREAQRLGEWHAQHLPDNGEFLYRRQQFKAWLWEGDYQRFLPANVTNAMPRLLDLRTPHERTTNAPRTQATNARSPEVRTPANAYERQNEGGVPIPAKTAKGTPPVPIVRAFAKGQSWDDVGRKFFEIFPDGTQAALRQVMSQLDGREPKSFKGEAYRVYHSHSPKGNNK